MVVMESTCLLMDFTCRERTTALMWFSDEQFNRETPNGWVDLSLTDSMLVLESVQYGIGFGFATKCFGLENQWG